MLPSPADVEPRGLLGRRLSLCRERQLLVRDEEALLAGFERRPGSHPWIGEHVGKWLDAASTEYTRTGDERLRVKLDRVARRLRATQESDGYLGTYLREARWTEWDVWVHKYGLLGLLAHHAATGDGASLETARRIGELLRATFGRDGRDLSEGGGSRLDLMSARVSTHRGMAAGSVLVGLCRLARVTGDVAILDFARQIAARFEAAGGPQIATSLRAGRGVHETANAKAYEMLSCLAGLVDLARLTGEARDDETALRAVEPALLAFDDVVARQLYVTGGLSFEEFFRAPGTAPSVGDVSETCAVVSWMQLCAELFEFTGERRFLEPFERALWNHLLAAQRDDGAAFGYFTPLAGPRHCRDDVHCCGSSGPRGLALAPQLLFSVQESVKESDAKRSTPRVEVNLLCDARLRTRVGGGAVEVALATRFPKAGVDGAKWSVAIEAKSGGAVELAVAVPSWAPRATLRGATIVGGATSAKSGASIVASLAANGTASFELDLEGVAVRRVEGHGRESGRVAFEHGPFVLARPHGGGELVPFHGTSDPADPLAVWQEATA